MNRKIEKTKTLGTAEDYQIAQPASTHRVNAFRGHELRRLDSVRYREYQLPMPFRFWQKILILLIFSAFSSGALASEISPKKAAQLLGQLLQRTQDFAPLHQILMEGDEFYAYGSTARQGLLFLQRKQKAMGSWVEVEKWLNSTETIIPLSEWLNPWSDLDFIVIDSALPIARMRAVIPGAAILFEAADVAPVDSFLGPAAPGRYHINPLANIAVSSQGVILEHPALHVMIDGVSVSVVEEGIQALLDQRIPVHYNAQAEQDPVMLFDSYLRILRVVSEEPTFTINETSRTALLRISADLRTLKPEAFAGIQQALRAEFHKDTALKAALSDSQKRVAELLAERLLKIFYTSRDAEHTTKTLQNFGFFDLLERAQISRDHFPRPLPAAAPPERVQSLPKQNREENQFWVEMPLLHARAFQQGAFWLEPGMDWILGQQESKINSFGFLSIPVTLDSAAREGVDYSIQNGELRIRTAKALRRNEVEESVSSRYSLPETLEQLIRGLSTLVPGAKISNNQTDLLYAICVQILRSLPQSQTQLHKVLEQLLRIENHNWNLEILTKHASGKWIKLFDAPSLELLSQLKWQSLVNLSPASFATTGLYRPTKDFTMPFDPHLHWGTIQNHNLISFILKTLGELKQWDLERMSSAIAQLRELEEKLLLEGIIEESFLGDFKTNSTQESRCSLPLEVRTI